MTAKKARKPKSRRYWCMFCNRLRVTDFVEPIRNGIVVCRKCEKDISEQSRRNWKAQNTYPVYKNGTDTILYWRCYV